MVIFREGCATEVHELDVIRVAGYPILRRPKLLILLILDKMLRDEEDILRLQVSMGESIRVEEANTFSELFEEALHSSNAVPNVLILLKQLVQR